MNFSNGFFTRLEISSIAIVAFSQYFKIIMDIVYIFVLSFQNVGTKVWFNREEHLLYKH